MSMVFCRGCAKEIHATAQMCPQCGAPQFTENSVASGGWGNAMAWIIACAPLIGAFAGGLVSALFGYNGVLLVIVTIAINVFLCVKDSKELTKNGIDSSALNTWFVPLYLFQRAKLLNEQPGYPILWCVLFLGQLAGSA